MLCNGPELPSQVNLLKMVWFVRSSFGRSSVGAACKGLSSKYVQARSGEIVSGFGSS